MSDPTSDPAAHPLFSYQHSGNNGRDSGDHGNLKPTYYDNETQDFTSHQNLTRPPSQQPKKMYPLDQSSSFSTPPSEADEDEMPSCAADVAEFRPKEPQRFSPRKQLFALLKEALKRFMITVVLILCLLGTIEGFSTYEVMSTTMVGIFNSLVTGLCMTLGISIGSSFKDMAVSLRWWFLSRKKRPLHEVDEILECSSLRDVWGLGWRSIKPPLQLGMAFTCICWLLVNIAAQAGTAVVSLTFSLNPSNVPLGIVVGDVFFTNMSQSFGTSFDEGNEAASQLAAHTFGEMGSQFNETSFNSDNPAILPIEPISLDNGPDYWNTSTYSQYVFQEDPADSMSIIGKFYSNRSITTRSECEAFPVIDNLDGSSPTFHYVEDGITQVVQLQTLSPNATTYYTYPDIQDCGPRCASVYVFENSGTAAFYYKCQVNVSEVVNATVPEHMVSDASAKMAAAAIALQGFQAQGSTNQSQTFPSSQSIYGVNQNGSIDGMAALIRKFAIGVFVTSDVIMPNVNDSFSELLPGQGLELSLDHPIGLACIFAFLVGVHFFLVVVGSFFASKVLVPEDSYFAIAILLQPILHKIANQGLILGKKEHLKELRVKYGYYIYDKGGSVRRVGFSEKDHLTSQWEGSYDS